METVPVRLAGCRNSPSGAVTPGRGFGGAAWCLLVAWMVGAPSLGAAVINVTTASLAAVSNTWTRGNVYLLAGRVYLTEGKTLVIQPGTVIKGKAGSGSAASALFVCRGARIRAEGLPDQPIIFTSELDDPTAPGGPTGPAFFEGGLWGGVVLLGRARLNSAANPVAAELPAVVDVFEGLADDTVNSQRVHRFGGTDDDDNSGVLRYVSIRHAGAILGPNQEINGLTFAGVGRGTLVENVEVLGCADDGIAFRGGTVDTRYLVSAFAADDAFDIDQGYRGRSQFWFGLQSRSGSGDHGIEIDGDVSASGKPAPVSNASVHNVTLIGRPEGSRGVENQARAFRIRGDAEPKVYNGVFVHFQAGALVDTDTGDEVLAGTAVVASSFWHGIPVLNDGGASTFRILPPNNGNLASDPVLRGVSYTNDFGLDPRPGPGSPAIGSFRPVPVDDFHRQVTYSGAFSPDDLWITRWTGLEAYGLVRRNGGTDAPIAVAGSIAVDTVWARTNTYLLDGRVHVLAGATLTLEPGTVVKGRFGGGSQAGALFVTRGARLVADGTAANPIVFTAESDDPFRTDEDDGPAFDTGGLWGGVVLLGRARLNSAVALVTDELPAVVDVYDGLADDVVNGQRVYRFGGSDDDDGSGILRHVSIRHAGAPSSAGRKMNGLTLAGVGRGTTLESVEVLAGLNDGFAWWGGTVRSRYLAAAFCQGDLFDTDRGYRGQGQFWFGIQRGDDFGDHGLEMSGDLVASGKTSPVSDGTVYHLTLIGRPNGARGPGNQARAIGLHDDAEPKVYNGVFLDFQAGARVDANTDDEVLAGAAVVADSVWDGIPVLNDGGANTALLLPPNRGNLSASPLLGGVSYAADFGLDPRPADGSPAYAGFRAAPNDGYHSAASFRGAFGSNNWLTDWSGLAATGVLGAAGGTSFRDRPLLDLEVTYASGQATLAWHSQAWVRYQVQSTTDMVEWTNEGSPLDGDGGLLSVQSPVPGVRKMFRVLTL